jgi:hypothetical protein
MYTVAETWFKIALLSFLYHSFHEDTYGSVPYFGTLKLGKFKFLLYDFLYFHKPIFYFLRPITDVS